MSRKLDSFTDEELEELFSSASSGEILLVSKSGPYRLVKRNEKNQYGWETQQLNGDWYDDEEYFIASSHFFKALTKYHNNADVLLEEPKIPEEDLWE